MNPRLRGAAGFTDLLEHIITQRQVSIDGRMLLGQATEPPTWSSSVIDAEPRCGCHPVARSDAQRDVLGAGRDRRARPVAGCSLYAASAGSEWTRVDWQGDFDDPNVPPSSALSKGASDGGLANAALKDLPAAGDVWRRQGASRDPASRSATPPGNPSRATRSASPFWNNRMGSMPELVPDPLSGRMLRSPSPFCAGRGLMAHDLATPPPPAFGCRPAGIATAQLRPVRDPERNLVFDINDFDETLPAPWEWDVKRLAEFCGGRTRTTLDRRPVRRVECVRAYRAHARRSRPWTSGMTASMPRRSSTWPPMPRSESFGSRSSPRRSSASAITCTRRSAARSVGGGG